jgi:probable O-glycosylation ligase (exosortase A-associated)
MRDYAILLAIAISLPIILARPWTGILVWSWVGYMNPHLLGWGMANDLPLAMAVGVTTLGAALFTQDRKAMPWTGGMAAILCLALYFTMTTFFAFAPDAAWEQWSKVMKILLMTFITPILIFGKKRIQWLVIVITGSIAFYGIKGGIFSILSGGNYRVWGPGNSFIAGNNELGLAMNMVLPLLMLLAREEHRRWIRQFLYLAFWLTVIAILFTYSRGALLGLAAVSTLLFLKTKRKMLVILLLLPAVFFGMQFVPQQLFDRAKTIQTYQQDESAMQRLQAWSVAWNVAKAYPLVGGGFALDNANSDRWLSYADFLGEWNNRPRAAHSIYFQILGEHGFGGLLIFIFVLISIFFTLKRIRADSEKSPQIAWVGTYANATQIGLVGYMVSGTFLSLAYFDLFYAYAALTAILWRELKEGSDSSRPASRAVQCY